MTDILRFEGTEPELEVRSESQREIAIRFMKWGEIGRTEQGLEMFERGAFEGTDPSQVVLRMEHEGPPVGRGVSIEENETGAILVGRIAGTARGDEMLQLAKEGYFRGASPSFSLVEGGSGVKYVGRDRVNVRRKVAMKELSTTWRPTFAGTEVLYARTQELGDTPMSDAVDTAQPVPEVHGAEIAFNQNDYQNLRDRLQVLEERASTPTAAELPEPSSPEIPDKGEWFQGALTVMDGGDLHPLYQRTLSDIISADNPGFMPIAYQSEILGIIDPTRPFMQNTRRINMPDTGLSLQYPRITQRPTVAEQTTQKAEVSSAEVHSDTLTANVRTFAGAGDLSLQLLRRSSPQFLSFYLELLAEAYAIATDNAAVDALLAASPTAGGDFDPESIGGAFGEAVTNALAVGRTMIPDRIFLSTAALVAMVEAETASGGAGVPLYPQLAGIAGLGGGDAAPTSMRLTPVWTPALDDESVDVIIGPARGFAWAEEGTFTLQADVPGRLGRDVALGGFVVFVPAYPAAFTTYTLAS